MDFFFNWNYLDVLNKQSAPIGIFLFTSGKQNATDLKNCSAVLTISGNKCLSQLFLK